MTRHLATLLIVALTGVCSADDGSKPQGGQSVPQRDAEGPGTPSGDPFADLRPGKQPAPEGGAFDDLLVNGTIPPPPKPAGSRLFAEFDEPGSEPPPTPAAGSRLFQSELDALEGEAPAPRKSLAQLGNSILAFGACSLLAALVIAYFLGRRAGHKQGKDEETLSAFRRVLGDVRIRSMWERLRDSLPTFPRERWMLAAGLLLGLWLGGCVETYRVINAGSGLLYIVNRLTGATWFVQGPTGRRVDFR